MRVRYLYIKRGEHSMNSHLNTHGPIKISQQTFTTYQNNSKGIIDFDHMYYNWIDENHPDDLRILYLRDMLRQGYGSQSCNPHNLINIGQGFGNILHAGEGNKTASLYWTLSHRPKLLSEILAEFTYNLTHHLVPLDFHSRKSKDELIELLAHLIDIPDARQLLAFHTINTTDYQNGFSKALDLYDLWTPKKKMPEWLRTELWSSISTMVKAEITAHHKAITRRKDIILLPDSTNNIPALIMASEFIRTQTAATHKRPQDATPCLWLLETELPSGVKYINIPDVIRLAPKLTDEAVAFKFARRHALSIDPHSDDTHWFNHREGRIFLHWLRGLSVAQSSSPGHTNYDKILYKAIDNILRTIGPEA